MRIELDQKFDVEFLREADLSCLIPPSMTGRVLNYGQGEGQVQIANTVWGIYVSPYPWSNYSMQYEEGNLELPEFVHLFQEIVSNLERKFVGLRPVVVGLHEGKDDV